MESEANVTITSAQRTSSLLGAALVADGAAFVTNPSAQIALWSSSRAPRWYRRVMSYFSEHPDVCRALAGAELVLGMAMLARAGAAQWSPAARTR
jgi:hypothetical protein